MSISYAKRTECVTCGAPSIRKPRRTCPDCSLKVCGDCRRERICCEVERAQWPRHERAFQVDDVVMHRYDRIYGRIAEVLPTSCLVEWDRAGFGRTYSRESDLVLRIHTKGRLPHEKKA